MFTHHGGYDLEFVFLIISINDKIIKTKGNTQMKSGPFILKKSFLSKNLPRNRSKINATAHCEANPANFVHWKLRSGFEEGFKILLICIVSLLRYNKCGGI